MRSRGSTWLSSSIVSSRLSKEAQRGSRCNSFPACLLHHPRQTYPKSFTELLAVRHQRPQAPHTILHRWRIQYRTSAPQVCRADSQRAAVFPAGKRQAKVQLPACFIKVDASEVGRNQDLLGELVTAGVTGIVLLDSSGSGGADLYEAGVQLMDIIRGRAVLLVSDRPDIADAIEADGVALSDRGVPVLVARRMLKGSAQLVARIASSAEDVRTAASDGANLAILQGPGLAEAAVKAAKTEQGSSGGIPVVVTIDSPSQAASVSRASADGAALDLKSLSSTSGPQQIKALLDGFGQSRQDEGPQASSTAQPAAQEQRPRAEGLKHFLNETSESLLEEERQFLTQALEFLQEAAPEMEELSLLTDALKQLDELFLLVVVGEFNSGKSSIINALLGNRYLAEGILPTTNEISVLKFSENGAEDTIQTADGLFARKLPAELLRDINIVDTPGTNVILDRQQRLTEEYVPRADLVLFCMSADRPFTESETTFLKYIRQWGKKVVFVVNKIDLLSNDNEVNEVVEFVGNSATRLLGVERSQVLPVSARPALESKVAVGGGRMAGSILSSADEEALSGNPKWESSRFGALERFILNFLVGGSSASESVRLKLQTPLFVADALLDAAAKQLAEDLQAAEQEVEAVKSIQGQLAAFRREMARDGEAQRSECRKLVAGGIKRAQRLIDDTLQLSNQAALSGYIFGSRQDPGRLPVAAAFKQEVVGPAVDNLKSLVDEHGTWLARNCERQQSNYRSFAESRATALGLTFQDLEGMGGGKAEAGSGSPDEADERRRWRESRVALQEAEAAKPSGPPESSLAVVQSFDPGAGAVVLEEEIREAVINTAGAALGAGSLGVISTFILPNTLEDLFGVAIGLLVGYAALLNLPLRRNDAKDKLQKAATEFLEDLEKRMGAELDQAVESCVQDVNSFILPLQQRTEDVVFRIQGLQQRQALIIQELQELQQRAANIE